jgi:hypothetical protein
MARHLLIAFPLIVILAACGTAQPVAQAPAEVTRVITQIATRIVVVTATPQPTEPTAAPTNAPEPTAAKPTSAPEPTVVAPTRAPEPTAVPKPTVEPTAAAPEPTSAPEPLAAGETVPGKIVRTITVFDIPNEVEGKHVISAKPGDIVDVLYRGSQWYQIQAVSTADEKITGWVYRDWLSIAPEDAARVQTYPDALPVIVTKIRWSTSNGYEYWSGTVMNVGAKPASDVQVEISINGQVGDTETRAAHGTAFVAAHNLEAGQASKFTVRTNWVSSDGVFYSHKVLWTAR